MVNRKLLELGLFFSAEKKWERHDMPLNYILHSFLCTKLKFDSH